MKKISVILRYAHQENTDKMDEDGCPVPKRVSVVFEFSEKGYGFGELTLVSDENGQLYLDTECTAPDRVKRILGCLVDLAILDTDNDPLRHRRYNEVCGRQCGEHCAICREELPE